MATNVYRSEHRVFWDPQKPSTRYGFYITTSGDSIGANPFRSQMVQDRFVAAVKQKATELSITVDDEDFTAGLVTLVMFGESEGDREYAQILLQDLDLADALVEAMEGFDADLPAEEI